MFPLLVSLPISTGKPSLRSYLFALWFVLTVQAVALSTPVQAQKPVPVVVSKPSYEVAVKELRLAGSVVAQQQAALSARVDGAVAQVLVDAGSVVAKGDVLIMLDDSLERHQLAQQQAELAAAEVDAAEAQRRVAEVKRLSVENHIAATELEQRQATLAMAQARLQAAQAAVAAQQQRLKWHRITAPFAGVIVDKHTEVGEWVNRGSAVAELAAMESVFIDVQVPEALFSDIYRPGSEPPSDGRLGSVSVYSESAPELAIPARIAAQVPVANAASRSFRVRLLPLTASQWLYPGASATAVIEYASSTKRQLTIARDALLQSPDGRYAVFTVEQRDGAMRALQKPVTLGPILGGRVVIDGLNETDQVVVRGNESLRHEQLVSLSTQ